MLVYNAVASAVQSLACGGGGPISLISLMSVCFCYAVDSDYDRSVDYWVLVKFGEAVGVCIPFRLFQ
jgi:hypothetical protein